MKRFITIMVMVTLTMVGCNGGGGGGEESSSSNNNVTSSLEINVSGAKRLIVAPVSATTYFNAMMSVAGPEEETVDTVLKVTDNGDVEPVVYNSNDDEREPIIIKDVVSDGNGYFYMVVSTPIVIGETENLVLRINASTGDYESFDPEIRCFGVNRSSQSNGSRYGVPRFQPDSDGSIVYMANLIEDVLAVEIRRWNNGTVETILPYQEEYSVQDFIVVPGGILYTEVDLYASPQINRLKYRTHDGNTTIIHENNMSLTWMKLFPNGKIMVCISTVKEDGTWVQIHELNSEDNYNLGNLYWEQNNQESLASQVWYTTKFATVNNHVYCYYYGSEEVEGDETVTQIYPSVELIDSGLSPINTIGSTDSELLIAGFDGATQKIIRYNPQTEEVTDVNTGDISVENIDGLGEKVFFDGTDTSSSEVKVGVEESGNTTTVTLDGGSVITSCVLN